MFVDYSTLHSLIFSGILGLKGSGGVQTKEKLDLIAKSGANVVLSRLLGF